MSGIVIPSASFLYLQDSFGYQWSLVFPDEFFSTIFSNSENVVEILIGIALKLYITFGNADILMMLILPIQKHEKFLHLLISSSNSFFFVTFCKFHNRDLPHLHPWLPCEKTKIDYKSFFFEWYHWISWFPKFTSHWHYLEICGKARTLGSMPQTSCHFVFSRLFLRAVFISQQNLVESALGCLICPVLTHSQYLPISKVSCQNGAFVTTDKPTLTRQYHPEFIIPFRVHSWCTFLGFV